MAMGEIGEESYRIRTRGWCSYLPDATRAGPPCHGTNVPGSKHADPLRNTRLPVILAGFIV